MSQHFLNRAKIRAVLQKMGGKGMTKRMGCDFLLDSRLILIMFNDFPKTLPGHARTIHIYKESSLVGLLNQLGAHMLNIIRQGPDGG